MTVQSSANAHPPNIPNIYVGRKTRYPSSGVQDAFAIAGMMGLKSKSTLTF